jgi:hypothetical protein
LGIAELVASGIRQQSRRPRVHCPHQPVGIAPFRFTLHDESLAADRELIVGARVRDFDRPQLEIAVPA